LSWLGKLKDSLTKTSNKVKDGINNIFVKKKLTSEVLDEFEELLISCDIGVETSTEIIKELEKQKFNKEISPEEIKEFLAERLLSKFNHQKEIINPNQELQVIMICGVNGNGKTTSVAKLANIYKNEGKKVLIAACDTFRAAASDQLASWAERVGVRIHSEDGRDPASVAFDATSIAIKENFDILIIDTAGRLHNKNNLMDELAKINRVIAKALPGAPHEVFLVLDATTGQDALIQAKKFSEIVKLSGLIVTKLDGTAKAGIVIAINNKFKIPVVAIGIGEKIDDLKPFHPKDFLTSLLD
jgi:fused signal recognition particle receptor